MNVTPLISTGNLTRGALAGQVAVVTGAGGGIGVEAARALAWLGARVVVAEIDAKTGRAAAVRIAAEMGAGSAVFIRTDVGDERSVGRLARRIERTLGQADIVLNNATIAPIGAIKDKPIGDWDKSYRVNLRGPVLLARAFLSGMLARDRGVFVCVASSPGPYVGAYEVLKTAQVELANILAAELEGTNVKAFTIGPGIVKTATFASAIRQLAPLYGQTVEEFLEMNKDHLISVEAAGAGFAAAIALAARFHGQSIGVKAALNAAGIEEPEEAGDVAGGGGADRIVVAMNALLPSGPGYGMIRLLSSAKRPTEAPAWMAPSFFAATNNGSVHVQRIPTRPRAAGRGSLACGRHMDKKGYYPVAESKSRKEVGEHDGVKNFVCGQSVLSVVGGGCAGSFRRL